MRPARLWQERAAPTWLGRAPLHAAAISAASCRFPAAAFDPSSVMGSAAEELMVCRLFAGGNEIRTLGPHGRRPRVLSSSVVAAPFCELGPAGTDEALGIIGRHLDGSIQADVDVPAREGFARIPCGALGGGRRSASEASIFRPFSECARKFPSSAL